MELKGIECAGCEIEPRNEVEVTVDVFIHAEDSSGNSKRQRSCNSYRGLRPERAQRGEFQEPGRPR